MYTVSVINAPNGQKVPAFTIKASNKNSQAVITGAQILMIDKSITVEVPYDYGASEYNQLAVDLSYGTTSYTSTPTNPDFKNPVKYTRKKGDGSTEEYILSVHNAPITRAQLDILITSNKDLTLLNTSTITNMGQLFVNQIAFNQDISGWDVSKVTDMADMFNVAESFDQDLSFWKNKVNENIPHSGFSDDNCPLRKSFHPYESWADKSDLQ